jgi:zinc transport system substrate-binding protein
LSRQLPAQREAFEANFGALENDLMALDSRLTAITARDQAKPLFASHPVYQYLARRYEMNLKSVMWEPDAVAPPEEWQALAKLAEEHPAKWMLWEDAPSPDNLKRLQELGIESIVFNPCGNRQDNGDFLAIMKSNLENIEQVFR